METGLARYYTLDIESAGDPPTFYPVLSVGLCLAEDVSETCYFELRPQSRRYRRDSMKIGALHLECLANLKEDDPRYDATNNEEFDPEAVLRVLERRGISIHEGMERIIHFVDATREGRQPRVIVDVEDFDYTPIKLMLADCGLDNIFGFKAHALKPMWQGYTHDPQADPKRIFTRPPNPFEHHARYDAIDEARIARMMFQRIYGDSNPIYTGIPIS